MVGKLKLSSLHLKIIATVFMIADHIAYFFIDPSQKLYLMMRIIGRLAAPLFLFCFVEGYKKTSNRKMYTMRLFLATIIMALGNFVCYLFLEHLTMNVSVTQPNMFLVMFLMALVIECIKKIFASKKLILKILFVILLAFLCLAVGCGAEYSWYALCSVLCLFFIKNKWLKYTAFILCNVAICLLTGNIAQMFMIVSVLFMAFYNEEKPKRNIKWPFYVFYPAHLWILMLISSLV